MIINSGFNISENILLIRSTAVYKNGSTFCGKQTTCTVEFVCLASGLVSAPLIIPFLFSPCVCKTFCFETRSQSCLQEEFQRLKILTPNPPLRIENNNLLVLILFIAQQLVRAECVRQRNEVAIKLGIIFSSSLLSPLSSRHLLNLQERVVVGFPNFAWAPK